jgi:hypothetical protein
VVLPRPPAELQPHDRSGPLILRGLRCVEPQPRVMPPALMVPAGLSIPHGLRRSIRSKVTSDWPLSIVRFASRSGRPTFAQFSQSESPRPDSNRRHLAYKLCSQRSGDVARVLQPLVVVRSGCPPAEIVRAGCCRRSCRAPRLRRSSFFRARAPRGRPHPPSPTAVIREPGSSSFPRRRQVRYICPCSLWLMRQLCIPSRHRSDLLMVRLWPGLPLIDRPQRVRLVRR